MPRWRCTDGDVNCDVEVQFGDIDLQAVSQTEVKANALANSAVKVHMPGSGWTDNEVLEGIQITVKIQRNAVYPTSQGCFGRDDIESVN